MFGSRRRLLAVLAVFALVAVACGGDDSTDSASGETSSTADGGEDGGAPETSIVEADPSLCPVGAIDALDASETPVQVEYWHAMTENNLAVLEDLVDEFNGSQDDVEVSLVAFPGYEDTQTRLRASLGSDDLPDLVQLQDTATRQMIDSQSMIPAASCIAADGYDMSHHLQRIIDYYTVEGQLWPMPFNVSNNVLYYNKNHFAAAGLDPEDPPTTLDEIRAASQAIVDAGVAPRGYALKLDGWVLEQWTAMAGEPYVNNSNGREARETEVLFENDAGLAIFEWMNGMVADGLAENTGKGAETSVDHYLSVANENTSMTIETSAAIGTILNILESGQFPNVELGIAPLPGPPGDGGPFVAGGANYIVAGSDPAKVEGAWRFAKFLNDVESQAAWAQTGYIPIREDAAEEPSVQQLWTEMPEFRIAYDQLSSDVNNVATAGPVIGDYLGARDEVIDAMERMLTSGVPPADALAEAKRNADEVISRYNQGFG